MEINRKLYKYHLKKIEELSKQERRAQVIYLGHDVMPFR